MTQNQLAVQSAGHDAMVAEQQQGQFLTFCLGSDMYAIGILHIKEILEFGQLTAVPMMPDFIRGVINLRGSVVPVIDLSSRFGHKRSEVTKRTCIVIIEVKTEEGKQDIGVIVDSVSEVLEIAATDIEPPPAFGANIRADFIAGMGKINDRFVILLEVSKVLSVEEIAQVGAMSGDCAD